MFLKNFKFDKISAVHLTRFLKLFSVLVEKMILSNFYSCAKIAKMLSFRDVSVQSLKATALKQKTLAYEQRHLYILNPIKTDEKDRNLS